MTNEKKQIDKKEDKAGKILTGIANLEQGETISYSTLARMVNIHPNTLKEKLDEYELAKSIGWKIIRDNDNEIKLIIKTDEYELRNEVRDLKKEMIDLKKLIDELKLTIKSKSKR